MSILTPIFSRAGHHANCIVVSEYAVDRALQVGAEFGDCRQCGLKWAECCASEVAGQHTYIVTQGWQKLGHPLHSGFTHITVQIAELEDREPIERVR